MDRREQQTLEMSKVEALYEESFVNIKHGDLLTGKIVKIEPERLYVDIGGKTEGILPREEFSYKPVADPENVVKVGDEIEVFVVKVENSESHVHLSRKRAELERTWNRIRQAYKNGETLEGTLVERIKGGLSINLGVRGFLPASHIGRYVKNLEDLIGESLPVKVLELEEKRRRVVVSHRLALQEENKKKKEAFWKEAYEGQLRTGTVVRLSHFGAFVDLGGIDGLIHLSELSWKHAKHPSEVLKIGDVIEVILLGLQKEKERISLSLRRAQPDPWIRLPENFRAGAMVEGKMTKIASRYIFAEVYPGVEGVIPRTEWEGEKIPSPAKAIQEKEKIRLKVLEIKPESHRMILSLKQASLEPESEKETYREYLESREEKPLTVGDILGEKVASKLDNATLV